MDLKTFNKWRNEVHNREKRKIRQLVLGTISGILIFVIMSITSVRGDKADFTVKVNGNRVDSVNYVDDINNVSAYFLKEKTEYVLQAESLNNSKELDEASKTLDKKGIENLIFVEGNLIKLEIQQSFKSREEAENYASILLKKGLLNEFTVRVK